MLWQVAWASQKKTSPDSRFTSLVQVTKSCDSASRKIRLLFDHAAPLFKNYSQFHVFIEKLGN